MPKRTDIHSILIIGSGPIVIGQAQEFEYSGVQAVKVLRREGYRVIVANSNPASLTTDIDFADVSYVEPLTHDVLRLIIAKERPDAILPTVGGQTGLNLAMELARSGTLDEFNVELIGANAESIDLAEDRARFRDAMIEIGLEVPISEMVTDVDNGARVAAEIGYPVLLRPSFTLGGTGGGIARDEADLRTKLSYGLALSPVHSVLVEQSIIGWKEFELEVMRDRKDNVVIVCTIENLDPMGVHTGDSITIAPSQTLTDREYQVLRDMARKIVSRVGLATGGANVQFAVNPHDGRVFVIEMNPRVSRSSALASKATGFPIAKIAALLAVGYSLDEIANDITKRTRASFEPTLDYVVVKIPRWNFEKFPGVDSTLGPQMKAVGEVMGIGRTFPEALQKAITGLDIGIFGFGAKDYPGLQPETLHTPTAARLYQTASLMMHGISDEEVATQTGFDPWFVAQMRLLVDAAQAVQAGGPVDYRQLKRLGFTDRHIGDMRGKPEMDIRRERLAAGVRANFYRIDTCAAEFEALTPYLYSTYERDDEVDPTDRQKVMILGGGPNRIGQGIEFDLCCVHACFALQELGYEVIIVNCNPETVSTDYDTADRLYFEPLTVEHILNVVDAEKPAGVLVQFGGQTPLNVARALADAGVPMWGTSVDSIDLAEDRERFNALMRKLEIPQPEGRIAHTPAQVFIGADEVQYPVLIRPSYVLGGRGMSIAFDRAALERALSSNADLWDWQKGLLIDHYLQDAYEIDVDALADGQQVVIGGIMEHIEEAGVHSGDSACVLPPYKITLYHLDEIREYTEEIGLALGVRGLFNIQYAIKDDIVYVLEVNPRASRTVPFVSKATNIQLAKLAAQIATGKTLDELGFTDEPTVSGYFVKEAVLPFRKFPGADPVLGPEMKSTGEVMGHASSFGHAFAKSQIAAGENLPLGGGVLFSVNRFDQTAAARLAKEFLSLGFEVLATDGTAEFFRTQNLTVRVVNKISQGTPNIIDAMRRDEVDLVINTPLGSQAHDDGISLRSAAYHYQVPLLTTLSAAAAALAAIKALRQKPLQVRSLQEHHRVR
jgi:carbamoyl-phosphate synthase large subunit